MAFENFIYFEGKKKNKIRVKICRTFFSKVLGLMFRKNSSGLLFVFKKKRKIDIHSFFCKPFQAIFLDDKNRVTKKITVNHWKLNISGWGKYLLEVPLKKY